MRWWGQESCGNVGIRSAGTGRRRPARACPLLIKGCAGERGAVGSMGSLQGHKGQRKEIPRSQPSDRWGHLTRKQPAWEGSEYLILGGMQAETECPAGEGAVSEAQGWGGGVYQTLRFLNESGAQVWGLIHHCI